MRRFQIIVALVVALATSVGLRAAARHRHWAGAYGPWATGHAGRFGPRPGHWGWGHPGCWDRSVAPASPPPAPAPVTPAAPQPQ